jgi:hypothetical protein
LFHLRVEEDNHNSNNHDGDGDDDDDDDNNNNNNLLSNIRQLYSYSEISEYLQLRKLAIINTYLIAYKS